MLNCKTKGEEDNRKCKREKIETESEEVSGTKDLS